MQKIRNDKFLGQRIRKIRTEAECGVEELAQRMQLEGCDIIRQALVKIESGKRNVSVQELNAIKEALNTTFDCLLDMEGE